MARLNLTLDDDTAGRLEKHARGAGTRTATLARQLLREALDRREAVARRRKLASDYAAGRPDVQRMLADLEQAQTDLLSDEND